MIDWVASTFLAGLVAYLIHSTVLLGAAAFVRSWTRVGPAWEEHLWRVALVGALVSVGLQGVVHAVGPEFRPAAGTVSLEGPATPAPVLAARARAALVTAAPVTEAEPPEAASGPARSAVESERGPFGLPSFDLSGLPRWIAGLWGLVATILLLRVAGRHRRFIARLGDRVPVEDLPGGSEARTALLSVAARSRLQASAVRLTCSRSIDSPIALPRTEICVPPRFLRMAPEAQRAVLGHELAHLERGDAWWMLIATSAVAVFFFQPLLRTAGRRLRELAEYGADERAVRLTGSPVHLARSMAEVAAWAAGDGQPAAAGIVAMVEGKGDLVRRVERLLDGRPTPLPRFRSRAAVASMALLAATVCLPSVTAAPIAGAVHPADVPSPPVDARSPGASSQADPPSALTSEPEDPSNLGSVDARPVTATEGDPVRVGDAVPRTDRQDAIPEALRQLLDSALAEPSEEAAQAAVEAAGRIDSPATVPGLLRVARESARREVRVEAAETLGTLRPELAVPALAELASIHSDGEVRQKAVEALAAHPVQAALPVLERVLYSDRDPDVLSEALETAAVLPRPAARPLLDRIVRDHPEGWLRDEAASLLGSHPSP